MQNNTYKNRFAVSQSAIKQFKFRSPRRWKDIWIDRQEDLDKDEEAFTFGSLVDTILFTPDLVEERFYIADVSKIPTGNIEKIVRWVYDNSSDDEKRPVEVEVDDPMLPGFTYEKIIVMGNLKNKILDACDRLEWNQTWKADTRVNKIIEKGEEYFNLLVHAKGRKVITSEVNLEALTIVNKLRQTEKIKDYFVDTPTSKNIFQLEIFGTYNTNEHFNVPVKCAIDILHVDYKNKLLTVCDFKTAHSAFNFLENVKKFGYCDQLSFYTWMLRENLGKVGEIIGVESFRNWRITEPINIVIDEVEKTPYIYEYDWRDINLSQDGNAKYLFEAYQTHDHGARIKKGWMSILEEIGWHMQNDKWDYPVEMYKTGKLKINLVNS